MSIKAYNRGSRLLSKNIDTGAPTARAEKQAVKDEVERLRNKVSALERDLARARRCLAAERLGRENLARRLAETQSVYAFAVGVLCRVAFSKKEHQDESLPETH